MFREICLMKVKWPRFLFPLVLLVILLVMIRGKPSRVIMEGWVSYLYLLLCFYAGQWVARKKSFFGLVVVTIVFSLLAAIIWTRFIAVDAYLHAEIFSVIIPVTVFLLGTGMLFHVLGAFFKSKTGPASIPSENAAADHIFIKAEGKMVKVLFADLLFAEASRNYTKVVAVDQTLPTPISFSNFEQMLPASQFIRVHRSFIINRSRITHIEGNRVYIQKHEIPIGESYKIAFFQMIGLD
jgi:hypothetical protein